MNLELIWGRASYFPPDLTEDRQAELLIEGQRRVIVKGGIHLKRFDGQQVKLLITNDPEFPLKPRAFYAVKTWFERRFPGRAARMREQAQEKGAQETF